MKTGFESAGEIVVEVPNSFKESSGKYLNMGITATYDVAVVFTPIGYPSLSFSHLPGTRVQADNPWC